MGWAVAGRKASGGQFRAQLADFLLDLVQDVDSFGPVEANPRRPFLQLKRPREGGQGAGDAVQGAGGMLASDLGILGAFGGLLVFPAGHLGLGIGHRVGGAENMRMPPDHLIGDGGCHSIEIEGPLLSGNLGVKHHLKQQVAQLVA